MSNGFHLTQSSEILLIRHQAHMRSEMMLALAAMCKTMYEHACGSQGLTHGVTPLAPSPITLSLPFL